MAIRYRYIGLLLLPMAAACDQAGQDVSLRLTHHERSRIDTIYSQRVQDLRPELDSLCDARYPDLLDAALDSIIEERIRAEERLRNRPSPVEDEN